MMKQLIVLIFAAIPLWSCSQTDEAAQQELTDIPYYDGAEFDSAYHRLNLVLPEKRDEKPAVLLWVGGGAWAYVDRHVEMPVARNFAKQGIAVASVGHRLSPAIWQDSSKTEGIAHPEHLRDIARAFKWLKEHGEEYGYDANRIFVGGFSSGGYLTAMLSMAPEFLEEVGYQREDLAGVIPIGGAYDIYSYYETFLNSNQPTLAKDHVQAIFGETKEEMLAASPTELVNDMVVPMLLVSETMTFNYTQLFEDAITEAGFEQFDVLHVHTLDHGGLWRNMGGEEPSFYLDVMVRWMKRR